MSAVVYYFVIGSDGNRYGPADVDTLVEWTREGRIVPGTMLIERGTERSLHASELSAVAAELRRRPGAPNVAVERGAYGVSEQPTMSQPGRAHSRDPLGAGYGPLPDAPVTRPNQLRYSSRSRVAAGLLGMFLGSFGVHRFYLGYTGVGVLMLLLSIIGGGPTLGISCGFVGIWGFIEGILCLSGGMKDADGRELRD